MTPKRLRILFDSEVLCLQVHGGVSRYYVELLRWLPEYGIDPVLFSPISFNHQMAQSRPGGFHGLSVAPRLLNRVSIRLMSPTLRAIDRVAAHFATYDVMHQTYFFQRYPHARRVACTVFDMIPEVLPEHFPRGNPHLGKAETVRNANLVLTISENTKRDLLRLVPGIVAPVEAVHLAVDTTHFSRGASGVVAETGNYFLFIGQRHGYKNFPRFAVAASRVLARNRSLRLLCVGGGPLLETELEPFRNEGVGHLVSQRSATDDDLPEIYRRAIAFVYPSLYEGFGLPLLEAFASSCPVALSSASCFPEIADDAGIYFDPNDVSSIEDALLRVSGDSSLRATLRGLGVKRLGCFSWQRTASEISAAYRSLVQRVR